MNFLYYYDCEKILDDFYTTKPLSLKPKQWRIM